MMRFSLISVLKSVLSGTDLNTPFKFSLSTSNQSHSSLDSAIFKAAAILKCPLFDSLPGPPWIRLYLTQRGTEAAGGQPYQR